MYDPHTLQWIAADSEPDPTPLEARTYPVQVHQRGFSLVADHQATIFHNQAEAIQAIRKITTHGGARGGHFELIRCLTPLAQAQAALQVVPRAAPSDLKVESCTLNVASSPVPEAVQHSTFNVQRSTFN